MGPGSARPLVSMITRSNGCSLLASYKATKADTISPATAQQRQPPASVTTFPPRYADGPTARYATHMFDMCCRENGIEHRLTKPNHPWTNGQVERMNRTLKEATVHRYHYETHDQLREHLGTFLAAYNFARRLKTLKGLTPHEFICKRWTENPDQFRLDPIHHKLGLNT